MSSQENAGTDTVRSIEEFVYVVEPNGSAWFVDKATGKAWINQTALANLCGVSRQAVMTIQTTNVSKRDTEDPESLLCMNLTNVSRIENANNGKPHEVINSTFAFEVLEYYAFDSKAANDTARANFRAIAKAGMKLYAYDNPR